MIRPTTKHQRTKAQKRQENTAALLNLGWASRVEGKWFRPGSPHTYDFEDAVALVKLSGKIKSNSSMNGRRGGRPNGCPRTEKGKWGKKC